MKTKYLPLISIFAVLFFSCQGNVNKTVNVKEMDIIGWNLSSVKEVLRDSNNSNLYLVLLASGFDCGSCIENGLKLLKSSSDELMKMGIRSFCIISNCNTFGYQQRSGYSDYIFNDERDLIRKQIKFINTPRFILLDDNCKVLSSIVVNQKLKTIEAIFNH